MNYRKIVFQSKGLIISKGEPGVQRKQKTTQQKRTRGETKETKPNKKNLKKIT